MSAGVCLQEVHWQFIAARVLSLEWKLAAKALQAKQYRTMILPLLWMHNYLLSVRQGLIILLWYFSHGRTSYQILVSTDIVSVLEGLQLYYESHGHLTSDSCECFFVNADMALWHSFWKNSKMHSQVLLQALRVHIRRRWSETSWIANVDRSLYSFYTHTDFSTVINR